MANRTGYSLFHHVCRLLPLVLLLLAIGASRSALGQPSEDMMRLRSITPPMVDPASMGTRWAIWRDADGSDPERAFDAFLQIAHELGYWELEGHANAVLAERAMLAREPLSARLARAERLSPDSPALAWARTADISSDRIWALHEVLPSAWHAAQLTRSTTAGQVLGDHFVADLLARSLLYFVIVAAAALWWKTWSRFAFDLRLLLLRVPSWRQAQVIAWLTPLAVALLAPPQAALAGLIFIVAAYAGRRDVPVLVASLVAGTIFLSPPAPPQLDVSRTELYERAPVRPCTTTCMQTLESGVEQGSVAAAMSLAWVEYRLGTTGHRERAAGLIQTLPDDAFPYARALLTGHLALVDGEIESADAAYRNAFQNSRTPLERGAAGVALYRTSNLLEEREVAREMALEASHSGHPWTEAWRNHTGRSQNSALPILPLSHREVLRTETGEPWAHWWRRYRPWDTPWVPIHGGAACAGLLLAVVLTLTRRRSDSCRVCGTPTSRLILAEAFDNHTCVWCYQQNERTLRLEFEQRHAREYRAHRRSLWRTWSSRILAVAVPGFSGLASEATITGLIAAAVGSLAIGAWSTTSMLPTSVLVPAPDIWWLRADVWAPALMGFAVAVSLVGILFAQRRRSHE